MPRIERRARGFSLLEVLIAAAILSVVIVTIFSLIWSSKSGITRADESRESRMIADLLMAHAENADFVPLFKNFGTSFPECPPCLKGSDNDGSMGVMRGGKNVLNVDEWVLGRLEARGWDVDLRFRFLTRGELGYKTADDLKPGSGVLRFQAGVVWLRLYDGRKVMQEVKKCIYCPMILGRPGLDLKQCPAVNPQMRDQPPLSNYP